MTKQREKLILGEYKKPHVRIKQVTRSRRNKNGTTRKSVLAELFLNSGVVDRAGLRRGDRVDLYYERHSYIWGMPILGIKLHGRQLALSGPRDGRWLSVSFTKAVKQWELPLKKHRLEVLDFIEGEIHIDITGARIEALKEKDRERKRRYSRDLTEKLQIGHGKSAIATRSTKQLKKRAASLAARQDVSLSALLTRALEDYLDVNE